VLMAIAQYVLTLVEIPTNSLGGLMKRNKAIHHRIEQRTANRKHTRRRRRYFFRLANKPLPISREIGPEALRNIPMPTTGKIGEIVKALKRK